MAKRYKYNKRTGKIEEREVTPIGKIVGVSLSLVGLLFILIFVGVPYLKNVDWDKMFSGNSQPMCVMAEGLYLREKRGTESNTIMSACYGEIVEVIEKDETIWVRAKYKGKEGFMSIKGLLNQEDFNHLDSLWGNRETRDIITDLRDRMSLVLFINNTQNKNYHFYHSDSNGKLFWSGRLEGKHVFAFILYDVSEGKKIAAMYSYINGVPVCESTDKDLAIESYIKKVTYSEGVYQIEYGNIPEYLRK